MKIDEPYVIGLDWAGKNSWAYCRLPIEADVPPAVGRLRVEAAESGEARELLAGAAKIVVDAPIGLPAKAGLRPCDLGARRFMEGRRQGRKAAVFAVLPDSELRHWREHPDDRKKGHLWGLLPAIASAATLKQGYPAKVLESHPELVFACLLDESSPRVAKKTTLAGILLRLRLLREHGIDLEVTEIVPSADLGADDVLDAAAMALVALGWARLGPRLRGIRSEDGRPTELGEAPGADQVRLMALPEAAGRSTG